MNNSDAVLEEAFTNAAVRLGLHKDQVNKLREKGATKVINIYLMLHGLTGSDDEVTHWMSSWMTSFGDLPVNVIDQDDGLDTLTEYLERMANILKLHRKFQETGKPTGITLTNLESKLQKPEK